MGCYAAINALKLARHIVRSEPEARVLVVNLELCTLHLKETTELEEMLSFLLWGDGCAAEPRHRRAARASSLDSFNAVLAADTRELITWNIRDSGFDMLLSGQVPTAIHDALRGHAERDPGRRAARSIDLWAVHPGGRSVLDAVERALELAPTALARFARGAAPLRQHVVGDGDVRAGSAAPHRAGRRRGLRHVVRPGPRRRDDALPCGGLKPGATAMAMSAAARRGRMAGHAACRRSARHPLAPRSPARQRCSCCRRGIMRAAPRAHCSGRPTAPLLELGGGDGTFMLRVARKLAPSGADVDADAARPAEHRQPTRHAARFARSRLAARSARRRTCSTFLDARTRPGADVVVANLFLHHFADAAARPPFRALRHAGAALRRLRAAPLAPRRSPAAGCSGRSAATT